MPAVPTTPKGRQTRDQLLLVGRRVFARDGFVNMRMSDVANEADISLGGLYRYFENKEDLFEKVIGDIHDELYVASQPREHHFAEDPYAALLEANRGYLRHYYDHRDVMRALIEAAAVDSRFRDVWWRMRMRHTERFLASLARERGKETLCEPANRLAADAMACMVEQAAYVWYAQDALHELNVPIDEAAVVLTDAWHRLFFADEGSPRQLRRSSQPR